MLFTCSNFMLLWLLFVVVSCVFVVVFVVVFSALLLFSFGRFLMFLSTLFKPKRGVSTKTGKIKS